MKNVLKYSAIYLLLFLTLMVTGTTILFILNVSISKFHLIGSLLLSGGIFCLIYRKKISKKDFIKVFLISLLIIILSTLVSTFMFDRSSDGNTYHKDAIGVLKDGFNPVYDESSQFILERDKNNTLTDYAIWTDHYAKANWIMAANFYSLTGNIESGKAMNFISLYIVFILLFVGLAKILDNKKSAIISLVAVLNPVVSAQLFTYYNDQLVCLYLFLGIFMLMSLDKDINDKEAWFIYILSFILLSNTKFNGMGYILVFSFIFVLKYIYKAYKDKNFIKIFKKLCLIFIPLFIVSFILVGSHTYVKNTLDHQNPFFPLYDENGEDIITAQEPASFVKSNNLKKIFYGTFSKANNLRENDNTIIKIPFTFSKDEIKPAMSVDLRISGWGLFFSGLLIISIIIFIVKYKDYKKEDTIFYTLGTTLLLLIFMSESWWARYTPHFYLFIILSLYVVLKYNKRKILNYLYIALICVNSLFPLAGNTYYTFKNSIKINKQLKEFGTNHILIRDTAYNGVYYNLRDYKVNYTFDEIRGHKMYYDYIEYLYDDEYENGLVLE